MRRIKIIQPLSKSWTVNFHFGRFSFLLKFLNTSKLSGMLSASRVVFRHLSMLLYYFSYSCTTNLWKQSCLNLIFIFTSDSIQTHFFCLSLSYLKFNITFHIKLESKKKKQNHNISVVPQHINSIFNKDKSNSLSNENPHEAYIAHELTITSAISFYFQIHRLFQNLIDCVWNFQFKLFIEFEISK